MLKKILVRVRWRILLFCGIGLWMALCANDLYYNNESILSEGDVQNKNMLFFTTSIIRLIF